MILILLVYYQKLNKTTKYTKKSLFRFAHPPEAENVRILGTQ